MKTFDIGPARQASETVGWRNRQPVTALELFLRMNAWREEIARFSEENVAIYFSDTLEFIAALFAALSEDRKVWLPGNVLPATCDALARDVSVFLGEFPPPYSTLAIAPDISIKTGKASEADSFIFSLPLSSEIVIHTSGSTGEAKAIPKRLAQFISEVEVLDSLFAHRTADTDIVATVTHQHIYGLLYKVFLPLIRSMPIHAKSLVFPEEILAIASERRITLVSSPAHLKRFTDNHQWQQHSGSIGTVFSSGGPLEREAALKNRALTGAAPIEIYGSSESGGIAFRERDEDHDDGWEPLPGVLWRIDQEEGTLEVSSPWLDDWLRMADMAEGLAGHRFLLKGRTDLIVKLEEKRVSLTGIEKALFQSHLVVNAKVIPVDMEKPGRQRLAAFIVLSPEGRKKLFELGRHSVSQAFRSLLASSFERVAIPKIWRYPEEMPVNMQGKTSYADLKRMLDMETFVTFPHEKLLDESKTRILLELGLPKNLLYFQGHFPEIPILPGVVQLDWVLLYGNRYFALPRDFSGINALKFQQVILPGSSVHLELVYDEAKASLSFRYFSGENLHASGRISFLPDSDAR